MGTSTILLRSIKSSLPSLYPLHHSRDKISQALYRFSVLQVTESWAGPGNEASLSQCRHSPLQYLWCTTVTLWARVQMFRESYFGLESKKVFSAPCLCGGVTCSYSLKITYRLQNKVTMKLLKALQNVLLQISKVLAYWALSSYYRKEYIGYGILWLVMHSRRLNRHLKRKKSLQCHFFFCTSIPINQLTNLWVMQSCEVLFEL